MNNPIKAASRLRTIRGPVSTIHASSVHPDVHKALVAWIKATAQEKDVNRGVLIGALALMFYADARSTQDVDLLFIHEQDIPSEVQGFKHHRPHAFEHKSTGVEAEIVTCGSVKLPEVTARKVYHTAVVHDGIKVASREAMFVLKLHAAANEPKRKFGDLGDIQRMLNSGDIPSLDGWTITPKMQLLFDEVCEPYKP